MKLVNVISLDSARHSADGEGCDIPPYVVSIEVYVACPAMTKNIAMMRNRLIHSIFPVGATDVGWSFI
jgi:hypothetical protein